MTTQTLQRPAAPAASRSPVRRLRSGLARLAGGAAATASRLSGRGSGASIRGQVLLRLDPEALSTLLQGRRTTAVSGTNGKTTTTHLLAAAVRQGLGERAHRLVTNADGANLHHGLASALSQSPRADVAVLETDERVVADLVRLGRPEVLVLLNFSRDQLDRHHEIKALGRSWRTALEAAGEDGPVVVANAEEPLIVWAAQTAREVVWVDTASTWQQDASLCPQCGAGLARTQPDPETGEGGDWSCTGCDLAEPKADLRVRDGQIIDADGTRWSPALQIPGAFNVGNAAHALAAARLLGVSTEDALAGMNTVTSPAGRFATARFGTTTARLLLAKNPAGWAEALPLADTSTVVLAIDSAAADGRDVSWLWDVEYEQLRGRTVVCTGPRAVDLAVRLRYAEVEHRVEQDLARALEGHPEPVDVIATYTPFQRLRRMGGV
ncbi:MurT ligase domain-containing protein [Auraticoccus monumenti]|uniref:Lipid II isoglutaminyl synthase (glutamine-hydrolyzing) subunit MurT n=1 Tax=Auraticoccus monumenti TaxID=675864 RepID=A0A1G7EZJ8_9ACTN|nr:MurT ligase domain-containing protein [Auraticoccus monumenti]SDE69089.1 UDP-N-acetylmuramyl tripeptide synthase [Auraticoccus monumenti]